MLRPQKNEAQADTSLGPVEGIEIRGYFEGVELAGAAVLVFAVLLFFTL
jgi:hypothetical protein